MGPLLTIPGWYMYTFIESPNRHSSSNQHFQLSFVYYQPETITELVRKQKEHQIKKEVTEESDITDSAVPQSQDASEIEEITKPSTVIANPLTPPTPDPLTKDKTHIKVEALPVSSCGMMDRTRVALFAFMFTFLFINPLSYVIPQLDKGNYKVVLYYFSELTLWHLIYDIGESSFVLFASLIHSLQFLIKLQKLILLPRHFAGFENK